MRWDIVLYSIVQSIGTGRSTLCITYLSTVSCDGFVACESHGEKGTSKKMHDRSVMNSVRKRISKLPSFVVIFSHSPKFKSTNVRQHGRPKNHERLYNKPRL